MPYPVSWSEFDLHELTEVPAQADDQRRKNGERRDDERDDPLAALTVGSPGPTPGVPDGRIAPVVVGSGCARPTRGRSASWSAAGRYFTPAGDPPSTARCCLPPGALATPIRARAGLRCWHLSPAGCPAPGTRTRCGRRRTPSTPSRPSAAARSTQYVAHLRQPLRLGGAGRTGRRRAIVQPALDRLAGEIPTLSRKRESARPTGSRWNAQQGRLPGAQPARGTGCGGSGCWSARTNRRRHREPWPRSLCAAAIWTS